MLEYNRAIELDPGLAQPHSNLGAALLAQRKLDEAAEEERRAIKLDAGLALAHNNLAIILQDQGKPDDALSEYHHARSTLTRPLHRSTAISAPFLQNQRRFDEASAELRRAVELDATGCPRLQ